MFISRKGYFPAGGQGFCSLRFAGEYECELDSVVYGVSANVQWLFHSLEGAEASGNWREGRIDRQGFIQWFREGPKLYLLSSYHFQEQSA
jgi:hypothetical protein